jgi:NAD(P)-dependent dehydrogenase (short-subunit alcohol dehydrogenase family)
VTGGGTGIGAATAETFASAGAIVAVMGRRPGPLADRVEHIAGAGGDPSAACADAADFTATGGAVDIVLGPFGRIDIVVADAGIQPSVGPVLGYSAWPVARGAGDQSDCGLDTFKATVPSLTEGEASRPSSSALAWPGRTGG